MDSNILFKPIPNFEDYLIDRNGNIYSLKTRKFLKSYDQGYLSVSLYKDKKIKKNYLHRLLGITFIPNPNNLPCIDHIDRDRKNNKLDNLRWVNHLENRKNSGKNFNNKLGHKHICLELYKLKNGNMSGRYRIKIVTENITLNKSYDISKYSLSEVIQKRNEILTTLNLNITD